MTSTPTPERPVCIVTPPVVQVEGAVLVSDVKLVSRQVVHEGLNQEVSGEVEDQAKGDGDGQRWQSLLKDGQQQ